MMTYFKYLLPLFLTACTHGQIHAENDIFDYTGKNSDKYFTHGTKLSYIDEEGLEKQSYSIGQNIYTPSTKKRDADPAVLEKDRSYTAWLYGEYRDTKIVDDYKNTWGFQVGCVGQCAQGKFIQQGFHKLIGQGKPAWIPSFTQKSEPGFILEGEKEKLLYGNSNFDSSVYGLGKFGNIVDSASLGLSCRLGYNLPLFTSEPIIFKLPKRQTPWTVFLFSKIEERGVAYNHLLDGSLWQTEHHTVTSRPFVNEINLGATIGYGSFKITYTWFRFSSEWKEKNAPFAFGGWDIAW